LNVKKCRLARCKAAGCGFNLRTPHSKTLFSLLLAWSRDLDKGERVDAPIILAKENDFGALTKSPEDIRAGQRNGMNKQPTAKRMCFGLRRWFGIATSYRSSNHVIAPNMRALFLILPDFRGLTPKPKIILSKIKGCSRAYEKTRKSGSIRIYVFSPECTNGCGNVGGPKNKAFLHSWLSSQRPTFPTPMSPRKQNIRAFVAKLPAA
jgi:hypothetical protein